MSESNVREIFTHDHHLEEFLKKHPAARPALAKLFSGQKVDPIEYNLAVRAGEEAVKDAIYKKERSRSKKHRSR